MRYVYFMSWQVAGVPGNCESSLPQPIRSISDIREIETALKTDIGLDPAAKFIVTNFVLLRTEP